MASGLVPNTESTFKGIFSPKLWKIDIHSYWLSKLWMTTS